MAAHGHGHGHGRGHGRADGSGRAHSSGSAASARAGERYRGRLRIAFLLTAVFAGVEFLAAISTGSLALLSDAGHMLTDVAALGLSLAAITFAGRRTAGGRHSFGLYRLEVLAALVNAVLLLPVAFYVLWQAVRRSTATAGAVEVAWRPMLVVAAAGLLVNAVAYVLLREGAAESLNVRGAYLEVMTDGLGSLAVLIAGAVIAGTGWHWVDAAAAVALALFVLPRSWRLARAALDILMQAVPRGLALADLEADLAALPHVASVHDTHVWTLASSMEVATAHLAVAPDTDSHAVLDAARELLTSKYGIEHATLQVEPTDHRGCDRIDW